MTRLLALGIDALELDHLKLHLDILPTFKDLLEKHSKIDLNSTAHTLDASVWPTFNSASLPGEHGVYFPLQWDPSSITCKHLNDNPIWDKYPIYWQEPIYKEMRVGLLDLPMLPPRITGADNTSYFHWHTQESGPAIRNNRSSEWQRIANRIAPPTLGADVPADLQPREATALKNRAIESIHRRTQVILELLRTDNWDCFVGVYSEIHRAGHYFWPDPESTEYTLNQDRMRALYVSLDHALGKLLEESPPNYTLCLFALHGMAPNNSQAHFLPELLQSFATKHCASRNPSYARATRWLRNNLHPTLQRKVGALVGRQIRDRVIGAQYVGGVDWCRTPAYCVPTGGQGFVRFNLKGREALGCIDFNSERYKELSSALKYELEELRDHDTGKLLVEEIVNTHSDWQGSGAALLPDLSIIWQDLPPARCAIAPSLGTFKAHILSGRGGNHTPSAFALIDPKIAAYTSDHPQHISGLGPFLFGAALHGT